MEVTTETETHRKWVRRHSTKAVDLTLFNKPPMVLSLLTVTMRWEVTMQEVINMIIIWIEL